MKFVIILLLSFCCLFVKANDHSHGARSRFLLYHVDSKAGKLEFSNYGDLTIQNDYLIDVEDEEGELISPRKDILLTRVSFTHFHTPALFDVYTFVNWPLKSNCPASNTPTSKYITQRTLRI